jgi:hypothetical protein
MAQNNDDVIKTQLQVVGKLSSKWYEVEDSLASRFTRAVSTNVSTQVFRKPMPMRPGGKFRKMDFDGGDFGRGSGEHFEEATFTPVEMGLAYELTERVVYATNSTEKAIIDAVNRAGAIAMSEYKNHIDTHCQGGGTGIVDYVLSVAGTDGVSATPFYASNLREDTDYSVYQDSTQAVHLGEITVDTIDHPNASWSFTQLSGSPPIAGSVLCASGLTATPPVWLNGLAALHSNASTGFFLNIDRSTFPATRTPTVDGLGNVFTVVQAQALLAKMEMALGQEVRNTGKWGWYMHPGQLIQWLEQAQNIAEITLDQGGAANGDVDVVMQRKVITRIAGMPVVQSIHASRSRVDLIDFAAFYRGTMKDVGVHPIAGNTKWGIVGASGGFGGSQAFYLTQAFQIGHENPRRGGYIPNLAERTDIND